MRMNSFKLSTFWKKKDSAEKKDLIGIQSISTYGSDKNSVKSIESTIECLVRQVSNNIKQAKISYDNDTNFNSDEATREAIENFNAFIKEQIGQLHKASKKVDPGMVTGDSFNRLLHNFDHDGLFHANLRAIINEYEELQQLSPSINS